MAGAEGLFIRDLGAAEEQRLAFPERPSARVRGQLHQGFALADGHIVGRNVGGANGGQAVDGVALGLWGRSIPRNASTRWSGLLY